MSITMPCPPTPRQIQRLHLPLQTDDVLGLHSCSALEMPWFPWTPPDEQLGLGRITHGDWDTKSRLYKTGWAISPKVGSEEEKWATLLSFPTSIISNNTFLQVFCNTLGLILVFDEPTQLSNPTKSQPSNRMGSVSFLSRVDLPIRQALNQQKRNYSSMQPGAGQPLSASKSWRSPSCRTSCIKLQNKEPIQEK